MKTLQECKDEVCLRKHNHFFIMRHRRSIDELMAIMDEAAELYASQFREPSTEQSGGTEQEEMIILPKRLTAENGAKALLMGEFFEFIEIPNGEGEGEVEVVKVPVSWTAIKEIYTKIVEHYGRK